jgi:uncharacterized membrane protein YoaK (UPF0700 family)
MVTGLPNTVMTGNVTQIVLDVIELIHRGAPRAGMGSRFEGASNRRWRRCAALLSARLAAH